MAHATMRRRARHSFRCSKPTASSVLPRKAPQAHRTFQIVRRAGVVGARGSSSSVEFFCRTLVDANAAVHSPAPPAVTAAVRSVSGAEIKTGPAALRYPSPLHP